MTTNDGGPAFPRTLLYHDYDGAVNALSYSHAAGMSLRDYFAAAAITAMHLPHDYATGPCNASASERAYALADAMLAEREKRT